MIHRVGSGETDDGDWLRDVRESRHHRLRRGTAVFITGSGTNGVHPAAA